MPKSDRNADLHLILQNLRVLFVPFRPLFVRSILWIALMQICALFEPYIMKLVIDGIGRHGSAFPLLPISGLMLLVLAVFGVIQVAKNRSIYRTLTAFDETLPVVCGKKLLALPLVFHQSENTGILVGKVIRGVMKSVELCAVLLYEIIPLAIQTLVTATILIVIHWHSALILAPVALLFGWLTARVKLRLATHRMERHELANRGDELLGQAVTNVMTTQAFAQEERELRAIAEICTEFRRRCLWEFGEYDRTDLWRNTLVSFGRVAVIVACAYAVIGHRMSLGMLVFVSTLAEKVFMSCYRIGAVFDRLMEAADPVRHMVEIIREPITIESPSAPSVVVPEANAVTFDQVTYVYHNRRNGNGENLRPALDRITLEIRPGETIGMVGESGGGKSTFVKLLLRFDDPAVGAVRLNGTDIRTLGLGDLRRRIGYVPQDVEIYDLSVAENIAYGRSEATREDVIRAAKVANAHDFILTLERGYDTLVGNRGLRLSGGQRQRVGIARAVLLDPPILVFDEATSHVDVVSERKIQRAIEKLRRGKTVLLIAHRLSTVQRADRIVVMDRGRIMEIGTHDELVRHNGIYHRLVELQSRVDATL